jgi:hypothetical protein
MKKEVEYVITDKGVVVRRDTIEKWNRQRMEGSAKRPYLTSQIRKRRKLERRLANRKYKRETKEMLHVDKAWLESYGQRDVPALTQAEYSEIESIIIEGDK